MEHLIIAVLLLVIVAGAAAWGWHQSRQNALAVRERVMVNLIDGKALSGVLWARRGEFLILKDATLHERGTEPTPVDGQVLVERDRVDFVQVP